MRTARWLIAAGSLLLFVGAILHLYGYTLIVPRVAATNSSPEIVNVFKALWWSLSVPGIVLCPVIIWASRLPGGRGLVLLCTVIPAATGILLFCYVGWFIGSIIFSVVTVLLLVGGLMLPAG